MRAALLFAAVAAASAQPVPHPVYQLGGQPIWHPTNKSTQYVMMRSPEFTVYGPISAAWLDFTAAQSPRPAVGTTQSKLLGAAKVFLNDVLVTMGPGHNVPQQSQAVQRSTFVAPLLRAPAAPGAAPTVNVLGIQSYFYNSTDYPNAFPAVQAVLTVVDVNGTVYNASWTAAGQWIAYAADAYFNPDGNSAGPSHWYILPNEDLDRRQYPVGWASPGFQPSAAWQPAVVQPGGFAFPTYFEPAPAAVALRRPACSITPLSSQRQCDAQPEGSTVNIMCSNPSGAYITNITFASFGTPSGNCTDSNGQSGGNNFAVNASCNAPSSVDVVKSLCLGKASCSISVNKSLFGPDPCDKVLKSLAVAATCSGPAPASQARYVVDFGQEIMGGINLTMANAAVPAGAQIQVLLAEELLPDNQGVYNPWRTGNNYSSLYTLVGGGSPADVSITQHEFIQFRYAEIRGSPVPITADMVSAWIVQHPIASTGENPYNKPCAQSVLNARAYGNPALLPATTPIASWKSDNPGLDAVFNLTAYTATATTLDINVDSQSRQRDLCHVDALITGLEQYAVFSPGDYFVQRRTFLDAFGNDSAIWGSWYDFKSSGAIAAYSHALETGDLVVAQSTWSDDDMSITADGANGTWYNSLQFYSGVRYWNGSGNGLLHFPPAGCGGSWACDALADWPTNTRDGYDVGADNSDDAIRNGLGYHAISGMAALATWMGKSSAAARYTAISTAIQTGMRTQLMRYNGSNEAYFVDGAVGSSMNHAAIHSTLYASSVGVADGNATLAQMITNYLVRRDVGVSSSMTGRWWLAALYRLGLYCAAAADFALTLLSRTTFPSWGYMVSINATTTLEAWCPGTECKWNTDWAHPWSAAPAFGIPRLLLGASPLAPAWSRWQLAPQPSSLSSIQASLPTPQGMASFQWSAVPGNVTLSFTVPAGTSVQVCLPLAGTASAAAATLAQSTIDSLLIDGVTVATTALGRMLCAANDVTAAGAHTAQRLTVVDILHPPVKPGRADAVCTGPWVPPTDPS